MKAKAKFLAHYPNAYCVKIGDGYRIFLGKGNTSNPLQSYTKPYIKAPTPALAWRLAIKKHNEQSH